MKLLDIKIRGKQYISNITFFIREEYAGFPEECMPKQNFHIGKFIKNYGYTIYFFRIFRLAFTFVIFY